MEEAKRSNIGSNLADILPACIDLILRSQSRNQNNAVTQPNDDVIFVASKKVELNNEVNNKRHAVVYIDDEKSDSEDEGVIHSESASAGNYHHSHHSLLDQVFQNTEEVQPMFQPSPTTVGRISLLDELSQTFPNVDRDRVEILLGEGWDLNQIANYLLENSQFRNAGKAPNDTPSQPSPSEEKVIDFFKDYSNPVSFTYKEQCLDLLKNEFRRIYLADIRTAMRKYNFHYAPSRKCLEDSLLALGCSLSSDSSGSDTNSKNSSMIPAPCVNTSSSTIPIRKLMGHKRGLVSPHIELEKELLMEIEFVKKQKMLKEEKKDEIYAMHLNEEQYETEGQLIECGCCFGEFPFEDIVQCSDAHLFCRQCLQSYAKEVIFGSAIATAKLHCMSDGCTKPFPYSQLKKCLSDEEIEKYQERLQEDCLTKVDIPNLVRCPFCEFAAIVPDFDKVFSCLNTKCGKETCKDCGEEWKDHFGLKCNEVEKKSETNLRLTYEERMTMAKVRKCPKCSCQFMKSEGCNKMTCRCGQTMCYVCRKSGIDYNHFCRHPRNPGQKCEVCTSCSLWSDPSEDDELAVKQLEMEAQNAKRQLIENEDTVIQAKKQKV